MRRRACSEKSPDLLRLKYRAIVDAQEELGSLDIIKNTCIFYQVNSLF